MIIKREYFTDNKILIYLSRLSNFDRTFSIRRIQEEEEEEQQQR